MVCQWGCTEISHSSTHLMNNYMCRGDKVNGCLVVVSGVILSAIEDSIYPVCLSNRTRWRKMEEGLKVENCQSIKLTDDTRRIGINFVCYRPVLEHPKRGIFLNIVWLFFYGGKYTWVLSGKVVLSSCAWKVCWFFEDIILPKTHISVVCSVGVSMRTQFSDDKLCVQWSPNSRYCIKLWDLSKHGYRCLPSSTVWEST